MILTIEQIKQQLKDKFYKPDGELNDLVLLEHIAPPDNIEFLKQSLNIRTPKDFEHLISRYNFDNFSLGPICFGTGNDYIEQLIGINKEDNFNRWWGDENRHTGFIIIATSDPYTILLNTIENSVYAITSESKPTEWQAVADNFELFLRGVGSIFLKQGTPLEVEAFAHSQDLEFWKAL